MLKPDKAVLINNPGICLCQWTSFISVCPIWIKSNWSGKFSNWLLSLLFAVACSFFSSSSFSTAKSHNVIWLSDPAAANTLESVGCHWTLVIDERWCLNDATGVFF
jgi:hypothetical protein